MMISNSSYFVGVVLRPQQIIRTDVCVLCLPILRMETTTIYTQDDQRY